MCLFDLFRALPEHQVGRNRRSKDGDQAAEVLLAAANVGDGEVGEDRRPVDVYHREDADVGEQGDGQQPEQTCVLMVFDEDFQHQEDRRDGDQERDKRDGNHQPQ